MKCIYQPKVLEVLKKIIESTLVVQTNPNINVENADLLFRLKDTPKLKN